MNGPYFQKRRQLNVEAKEEEIVKKYIECVDLYISFIQMHLEVTEKKHSNAMNRWERLQHWVTLCLLEEEHTLHVDLFAALKAGKYEESILTEEASLRDRIRYYVLLGFKCIQQYKVTRLLECKYRAKGLKEGVKILISITDDVEHCLNPKLKMPKKKKKFFRRVGRYFRKSL